MHTSVEVNHGSRSWVNTLIEPSVRYIPLSSLIMKAGGDLPMSIFYCGSR